MQSNASSSKTPRRSIVRSLLQRITKKKDTKDFLDVSAETEDCQLEDDFFKFDANDDSSSADK